MTTPPAWVLILLYWLHMLATVTWVGSIAAMTFLVLPASYQTLKPVDRLSFIAAVQKRFEPIIWLSIAILVVSGLFQMSLNVHYNGFLSLSTQWSIAMLAKHSLTSIMIVCSAVQTWEVFPAIHRTLLQKNKAKDAELEKLNRREVILLRINLGLAALILLATAVARIS